MGSERYFLIDGAPFEVTTTNGTDEVRAMNPQTGAMVASPQDRHRVLAAKSAEVPFERYKAALDGLRGPIFERVTRTPLQWEATGDFEQSYAVTIDGHRWTCGMGEFPEEPLYLVWVDGVLSYSADDWPSAWAKPRPR